VLSVRFVDPEGFNRVFQDTPLEVILVNAQSTEKPDKAQAIAQFRWPAGGDADKGRATSPLPYSALTTVGDDFEEAQRKMDAHAGAADPAARPAAQAACRLPAPDPRKPSAERPGAAEQEKSAASSSRCWPRSKSASTKKTPAPRSATSAPPRARRCTPCTTTLRRKVEDKGTVNFPEYGGKKLYGELVMIVTVNHDGRVLGTEIVQGSGNPRLDRQAEAIAVGAGPFGSFNPDMRKKADQIAVVSRFKFTRDQTLETSVR
jgi:protein TonB